MRKAAAIAIAFLAVIVAGRTRAAPSPDAARCRAEASAATLTRDTWGIAHVHGRTDADAVFGAIYAQAEDDFGRIESNYLDALGRRAEADGASALWSDLRERLFVDPDSLQADYRSSPPWLRRLMDAWADGLNCYLAEHPAVRPRVLSRFEPWMALSFTEGSIGGDVEQVSLKDLQAFYDRPGALPPDLPPEEPARYREPTGSNGIAIAPANTANGHALLLINPHTSFFFRSELQMTSDEGLDAYGAATWGQFFLYQGFNRHVGWMHTSAYIDAVDEFAERVERRGGRLVYRYGGEDRPVTTSTITLAYRTPSGAQAARSFTIYRTHHGPVVRSAGGRWITVSLMNKPVAALSQSYLRTKATDYATYLKVATTYAANSSNDTVFADDKGEIAFLAPQFIPKRDNRFDFTAPVDGSDPATDWQGLTPLAETPHVDNPPNGWVKNTNDWAYSVAGPYSPKAALYPRYMDTVGENPRGVHAERLLTGRRGWTLKGLNRAAFDPWLPEFAVLIPRLSQAYDALGPADPRRGRLQPEVKALRDWDDQWSAQSVETSLAVYWGDALWARAAPQAKAAKANVYDWLATRTTGTDMLDALTEASDQLRRDWGDWRVPWGQINRFQRLDDTIKPHFSDAAPSLPVPFTSSRWGSLASFGTAPDSGTKRRYGTSGNSFVAVVEFGPRVKAVAVTAGGESGDPTSPHFDDQARRYAEGDLRPVYFYPDEVAAHASRTYHPGD
jgi:acyl-homoserine-lactone acylase